MKRLLAYSLIVGSVLCGLTSTIDAQEKMRMIRDVSSKIKIPLAVVRRHVGQKTFERDKSVIGDQDWLHQLKLDVKNVSQKNITYFELDLRIPKTGKMEHNGKIITIYFGNRMAHVEPMSERSKPDELLRVGDVVTVSLNESVRRQMEIFFEKYEVHDVEMIEESIARVYFDDGTGWYRGNDIKNPKTPAPSKFRELEPVDERGLIRRLFATSIPIPLLAFFGNCTGVSNPAASRIFSSQTSSKSESDPPDCGYLPPELDPTPYGCGDCFGTCNQNGDDILNPDPPGQLGYLYVGQHVDCIPVPVDCIECSSTGDRFVPVPTCGQPQGCGGPAYWGCQSPLEDINGTCARSQTYQNSCAPRATT